jgi:glycosyltransferase involved in cell wall biosynthesis
MAEALRKLAANPGLRGRMGAAGRARIVKDFGLENQVSQFLDLFTQTAMKKESN